MGGGGNATQKNTGVLVVVSKDAGMEWKVNGKVYPFTGTEALYRPYDPEGE